MEISKQELETYIREQFDSAFAFTLVTNDGQVITKYGEEYYVTSTPEASEAVLASISKIKKNNNT